MSAATAITYHSISDGPAPLRIGPARFAEHLDRIEQAGAETVTVSELAGRLERREPLGGCVAITLDDAYADVEPAAAMLAERGMTATVFAIAGYLGRRADWPTLPERAPRLPLASAEALASVAALGIEIGSHGVNHAPITDLDAAGLEHEIVTSRARLENAVGVPIRSFAVPYALAVPAGARSLIAATYDAACLGGFRAVRPGDHPLALPRIDAHYLRSPKLFGACIDGGLRRYLRLRGVLAAPRRLLQSDHDQPPGAAAE